MLSTWSSTWRRSSSPLIVTWKSESEPREGLVSEPELGVSQVAGSLRLAGRRACFSTVLPLLASSALACHFRVPQHEWLSLTRSQLTTGMIHWSDSDANAAAMPVSASLSVTQAVSRTGHDHHDEPYPGSGPARPGLMAATVRPWGPVPGVWPGRPSHRDCHLPHWQAAAVTVQPRRTVTRQVPARVQVRLL